MTVRIGVAACSLMLLVTSHADAQRAGRGYRGNKQPARSTGSAQASGGQSSATASTKQTTPPTQNPAVLSELNRIFRENGKQMPPMNAAGLPYANHPTDGKVRKITASSSKPASSTSKPAKKSRGKGLLSRWFGGLRRKKSPRLENPVPRFQPGTAIAAQPQPKSVPTRSASVRRTVQAPAASKSQPTPVTQKAQPVIIRRAVQSAPASQQSTGTAQPTPALQQTPAATTAKPTSESISPFTDVSEDAADRQSPKSGIGPVTPADATESPADDKQSPFTGVKLQKIHQTSLVTPRRRVPGDNHPTVAPGRIPASYSERELRLERIRERSGVRGFKGFCPVALRDSRQLIDTRPAFSLTVGQEAYYFSSAEAVERFRSNPNRYLPAAGGVDVVVLASTGDRIEGQLDHARWYQGKLFLFSSNASMNAFAGNPAAYASVN